MSSPIKILDYEHHDNFISEFLFDADVLNLKDIIKYGYNIYYIHIYIDS